MAAMTNYLEGQLRTHLFRTGTYAKPTELWVALTTADPTETGDLTNEVTGGSYAKQQLDPADANWTAASATDGHTDNAAALTYPVATANWGTITHFVILDGVAGNPLIHGALDTPKVVNTGDQFKFNIGAIDITFV